MHTNEIDGLLDFLRAAEAIKRTTRSAWASDGRRESVAEHTWRLCLTAMLVAADEPDLDLCRLLRMCIVHDLGEAIRGDVPAVDQVAGTSKAAEERADLATLAGPLPERMRTELLALWDEYEAAATREAKLAKALDKLETILQHTQGANPPDFDYRFNLDYGAGLTRGHPVIEAMRERLDTETERRARQAEGSLETERAAPDWLAESTSATSRPRSLGP